MSTQQRNSVPLASAIALALAVLAGCQREPAEAQPVSAAPSPAPSASATPAEPRSGPALRPASEEPLPATEEELAKVKTRLDEAAKAAATEWEGKTFEEFLASVYKEPGENGKYIVSGDVAIADVKQLQEFFRQMKANAGQTAHGKLTVAIVADGRDNVWNATMKRNLTYCVADAFGDRKAVVVVAMTAAAGAWEQAADVDFRHVPAEDGNCTATNPNVVFDVSPVDVGGEYYARAFFPSEPRAARNVLIDAISFELDDDENLTLTGILRHELGHALGWRHEHTRPESGACFEDNNWRPVSSYDAFSVMHYPRCNGGGDMSLTLTDSDKLGAACLYGAASGFTAPLPATCPVLVPPEQGTPLTKSFPDQTVPASARKDYDPFPVKPGTRLEVVMKGSGASPGDPDLYVRFGRKPMRTDGRFNCRPYLTGADETCTLDVPALAADKRNAFVMVYGYAAGSYSLEVKHTPPE